MMREESIAASALSLSGLDKSSSLACVQTSLSELVRYPIEWVGGGEGSEIIASRDACISLISTGYPEIN